MVYNKISTNRKVKIITNKKGLSLIKNLIKCLLVINRLKKKYGYKRIKSNKVLSKRI